ncbi:MAG: tol-pal system-associated acyl-CoA thioesterase, partial [Candidatus Omnitrophica bacterium CG23_combo_of_CG06-09_8_20_14_all_40_11]
IYYHHTDCGQVVYYAKYLEFLEEARTEFFEGKGISIKELAKQGVSFVVARQEIDYKSPAFYADILSIDTRVTEVGWVKLDFTYEMKNQNNQIVCTARTVMVCVNGNFKPQTIPEEIRDKLVLQKL